MTKDDRPTREQLDEALSAYLDEELDAETRALVEEHLATSPQAAETLAQLRQVSALVGGLPRGSAPVDLSESVVAMMEREELFAGIEDMPVPVATPPGALSFGRVLGAAAVLLIAVLVGYLAIDADRQAQQTPVQLAEVDQGKDDLAEKEGSARASEERENGLAEEAVLAIRGRPTAKKGPSEKAGGDRGYARTKADGAKAAPASPSPSLKTATRSPTATAMPIEVGRKTIAKKTAAPFGAEDRVPRIVLHDSDAPGEPDLTLPPPLSPKMAPSIRAKPKQKRLRGRVAKPRPAGPHKLGVATPRPAGKLKPVPTRLRDRLKAGMTVAELDSYPMDTEPVQMALVASSSDKRTDLEWALRAFLARNSVQDARSLGDSARLNAGRTFYLLDDGAKPGTPGLDRLVLRGTPKLVGSLVDDLSRSAGTDVQVTFATPTISAYGWDRTRSVVRILSGSGTERGNAAARAESKTTSKPPGSQAADSKRSVIARGKKAGYGGGTSAKSQADREKWLAGTRPPRKAGELEEKKATDDEEGPSAVAFTELRGLSDRPGPPKGGVAGLAASTRLAGPRGVSTRSRGSDERVRPSLVVSAKPQPATTATTLSATAARPAAEAQPKKLSSTFKQPSASKQPSISKPRRLSWASIGQAFADTFAKREDKSPTLTFPRNEWAGEGELVTVVITVKSRDDQPKSKLKFPR